jgi:hypothetical protein
MSELGLSFAFVLFVFLLPVLFLAGLFLLLMFLAVLGGPVVRVCASPPQRLKLTGLLVYDRAPMRGPLIAAAPPANLPARHRPVRTENY